MRSSSPAPTPRPTRTTYDPPVTEASAGGGPVSPAEAPDVAPREAAEPDTTVSARSRRSHPRWWRVDPVGLALATLFAVMAMTPSLIPRTSLFQGVVSGITGLVGYAVGVALSWWLRRSPRCRRLAPRLRAAVGESAVRAAWPALVGVVVLAVLVMLVAAARWQRELAALSGLAPPSTWGYLRAGPVAVLVVAAGIAAARDVRRLDHLLARVLRRRAHLPRRAAAVLAALLLGFVLAALANSVVLRVALSVADSVFGEVNDETYPGITRPLRPTRSGSPTSLVAWDSLGKEGRAFVVGGRSPAELAVAGNRAPLDPVRVYVGLETLEDPRSRAELAVAELDRSGAFSRQVVGVITTTGTGWVDDPVPDSLEAAYGGDTALVATQYSYLPSWLSFLVDRSRAEEDGRQLFDAVRARIDAMPPGPRPRLLAFGESLGSQGSEAAFSSLGDVRAHADGVLWVGPPHSNRLWSSLVERRDPGTPEIAPTYSDGLVVRFAGGPTTGTVTTTPPTPWIAPRMLYLQHPSDPVVWWSPDLLWKRPDWLVERRGDDVLGAMSWYPVITFWQVTLDLTNSVGVPDGHGHVYQGEMLDGWMAVAAPPGWTTADTERVRGVLAR